MKLGNLAEGTQGREGVIGTSRTFGSRGLTEGNTVGTQEPEKPRNAADDVSTRLCRIAEVARKLPDECLVSLAHYIDIAWLEEAFERTRKGGGQGVDGQTADDYREHLQENLESLKERAKSGTYHAPPVRRVYIPKPGSKETRPIGVPTFEDKVLQRAVVMVLEPIYEQCFHDFSYGFRPGKSQHQALRRLRTGWARLTSVDTIACCSVGTEGIA